MVIETQWYRSVLLVVDMDPSESTSGKLSTSTKTYSWFSPQKRRLRRCRWCWKLINRPWKAWQDVPSSSLIAIYKHTCSRTWTHTNAFTKLFIWEAEIAPSTPSTKTLKSTASQFLPLYKALLNHNSNNVWSMCLSSTTSYWCLLCSWRVMRSRWAHLEISEPSSYR